MMKGFELAILLATARFTVMVENDIGRSNLSAGATCFVPPPILYFGNYSVVATHFIVSDSSHFQLVQAAIPITP